MIASICQAEERVSAASAQGGFRFGPDDAYCVRLANDRESRRRAYALVYQAYRETGYVDFNPSGMVVSLFDCLPQTATFVVERGERMVATIRVVCDSRLGLPTDNIYHDEIQQLRERGRRLAGVVALAATGGRDRTLVLAKLVEASYLYAYYIAGRTDYEIIVSPRHASFYRRALGFVPLGAPRSDPRANGTVGCLERLDLGMTAGFLAGDRRGRQVPAFYRKFESGDRARRFLAGLSADLRPMTEEDLHFFFVEQTDILARATPWQMRVIASQYPDYDFDALMGKRRLHSKAALA